MTDQRLTRFLDPSRQKCRTPLMVSWRDKQWACATDGRRALLLADMEVGEVPDVRESLETMLLDSVFPHDGYAIDLAAFNAFVGPATPRVIEHDETCKRCKGVGRVRCPECNGSGSVLCECDCGDEHDRDCDQCDEVDHMVVCPNIEDPEPRAIRPVEIGNFRFNAALIASALADAEVSEGVAKWYESRESKYPCAILQGDTWALMMMGLRKDTTLAGPRFDLGELLAA